MALALRSPVTHLVRVGVKSILTHTSDPCLSGQANRRFAGPDIFNMVSTKSVLDAGSKRTLVMEAMAGHAVGTLGGSFLTSFVGKDKLSILSSADPLMTGVMGGGVLGTTLFSLASGDVGVLGSLFLACAGVAGQAGGVMVNDMNLSPFSLASPYDKDGVITSMVLGGVITTVTAALLLV